MSRSRSASIVDATPRTARPEWVRLGRRAALRALLGALATTWLPAGVLAQSELEPAAPPADQPEPDASAGRATNLLVESSGVRLRSRFDPAGSSYLVTSLSADGFPWVPRGSPGLGALWLEDVEADGAEPTTIDGEAGLELAAVTRHGLDLLHSESGLRIALEQVAVSGSAIVHRATIANAREAGAIRVGSAFTLSVPLWAGDWADVIATDDAPGEWSALRRELPISLGHHGLRSGESGTYPIVRLESAAGHGILVAVSTATAWRIEVVLQDDLRWLRAGEYRTDLRLGPGQAARLPEVVTIFYRDGARGAVESLQRYLQAVSMPAPQGWRDTPPAIFNTWFGYGCGLVDDGSSSSDLRRTARVAADAGIEVFVVDAGWYAGNPIPDRAESSYGGKRQVVEGEDEDEDRTPREPLPRDRLQFVPDDFSPGLGTWLENPDKWLARPGQDGSPNAGLRNFSDFVHDLPVRRPDGRAGHTMKFGLWFEPERFDPSLDHPDRVPDDWAIPGTPILDFSRPDVVDGVAGRLQRAIDAYQVDYIKVDSNYSLKTEADDAARGHFWTEWSAGFERLLAILGRANPGLYIEHCAGGLKRYWIGMSRVAHATWLDDDVSLARVRQLLAGTDALLLPRQKIVLVTEDFGAESAGPEAGPSGAVDLRQVVREYGGAERKNGGSVGLSSRIERWGEELLQTAADAIDEWKRKVR